MAGTFGPTGAKGPGGAGHFGPGSGAAAAGPSTGGARTGHRRGENDGQQAAKALGDACGRLVRGRRLDRNPLRRTSDRAESLVLILLVAGFLVDGVPRPAGRAPRPEPAGR